jgi:type IX secretion system PorP/SprF family membrane protein
MRKIITIGFTLIALAAHSQSARFINTYNYNLRLINPAFVGNENQQTYGFMFNDQWRKIYDAPQLGLLTYENRITNWNSGIGIIASSSSQGLLTQNRFHLQYAYDFKLNDKQTLTLGLGMIHSMNVINIDAFYSPDDPPFNTFKTKTNNVFLDFGIQYQFNNFRIGLAYQNFVKLNKSEPFIAEEIAFNIYTDYLLSIGNKLVLIPSIFYDNRNSSGRIDAGLKVKMFETLGIGYILRNDADLHFSVVTASVELMETLELFSLLYNRESQKFQYLGNTIELGVKINIAN